ncbi:hypothetical protein U1Q18_018322 [Sarracenia purpurea var. burkii]
MSSSLEIKRRGSSALMLVTEDCPPAQPTCRPRGGFSPDSSGSVLRLLQDILDFSSMFSSNVDDVPYSVVSSVFDFYSSGLLDFFFCVHG